MNCSDARFRMAAEPSARDAALDAHLQSCAACFAYAQDMLDLDGQLRAALAVPVPDIALPSGPHAVAAGTATPLPRRRPGTVARRFALAASVAGVAILTGLLWIGVPRESLAGAVVAHMAEEPDAWSASAPLGDTAVAEVLSRSGVRLDPGMPGVTYAHSCRFRGRQVPHLVVQSPGGPVTILVLPDEHVAANAAFEEAGYRGVLVPAGRGALAVLTRDASDVEAVAALAQHAIRYED